MSKNFIRVPYGLSVHGNKEIKAVNNVLKNSTQMGKNVYEFERKIAKLFNKKYGLMVNSGSSAIMLAMESLNLPEGSEVITPALTFSTTVAYIVRNKLVPVFVDVEEGTYCINTNNIEKLITKKSVVKNNINLFFIFFVISNIMFSVFFYAFNLFICNLSYNLTWATEN